VVKDSGTILEIQRMSTEDGPGIRTTVFFKGCSLRCAWCHNPESISMKPEIHWIGSRCIGCRTCLKTCTLKALSLDEKGMRIDRSLCTGCGECAEACPSTAMELLGHAWELEALIAEVIKDRAYFETSQGGITISGGEPTMQTPFAAAFLERLKVAGIHTALDTCGQCPQKNLDTLLPFADMVLFDIKLIDPHEHQNFTGHSNELILTNLKHVAASLREKGGTLWIRTPIIPQATDAPENISAIGAFISRNLDGCVQRWELCAFNNLCRDKYLRLDKDWAFSDSELIPKARMEDLAAAARSSGVDPEIVHWSGATRLEERGD
jgi:pyruvate formate lyase activating enzyme